MQWALGHYTILGLTTNLEFLREVVRHPLFLAGKATTHFLEEQMQGWQPQEGEMDNVALIAAALAEAAEDTQSDAHPHALLGRATTPDNLYKSRSTPWQRGDGFRIGS
jgi:acetyl/propionyl-CoA carboxylase alpha subunit